MPKVDWPGADKRRYIGKRIDRVDGPVKCTGVAKYSYDINRPGMLYAKLVTSPYAKAQVVSVDTAPAKAVKGVEAVWTDEDLKEVQFAGQIIAAVAARTEEAAEEAARLVKVQYNRQPHQVVDDDRKLFDESKDKPARRDQGNVDEAFAKADKVMEGDYGIPVITHCCLEPHGQVAEIRESEMFIWASTQAVSGYADRSISDEVEIPQNQIRVDCQHMGGGFGSKFNPGKWGVIGAILAKETGKPVKLMLDRDLELMIAGNRPSAYAKIKVGAQKDGTVTAMESEIWGTAGMGGGIPQEVPYVFNKIANTRRTAKRILTNRGSAAAWRAPNHPQQCFLTMSAMADMAAALGMDELEFFQKNVAQTDRPEVYAEQLRIAADMIGYKQKAHLRGDKAAGPVRRGMGMSIHTWGGRGHDSNCDVTIKPDGSVDVQIGSQDLGTGTRTAIRIVVAETLGLPLEAVNVQIGRNTYPPSGA
jgi:xanthine dehydrogenase YagR molybdenum-binding subunit